MKHNWTLREGLEMGDLGHNLVSKLIEIDRFKSKIGRDEDVVVVNFLVNGKEPATDLMSFVEKGYDFILDAEASPGENEDGQYEVFVEIERSEEIGEQIQKLISDVCNLTENDAEEWKFTYRNGDDAQALSEIVNVVPLTTEQYLEAYADDEIDNLKSIAGLPIKSKAPKTDDLDEVRRQAGII